MERVAACPQFVVKRQERFDVLTDDRTAEGAGREFHQDATDVAGVRGVDLAAKDPLVPGQWPVVVQRALDFHPEDPELGTVVGFHDRGPVLTGFRAIAFPDQVLERTGVTVFEGHDRDLAGLEPGSHGECPGLVVGNVDDPDGASRTGFGRFARWADTDLHSHGAVDLADPLE